MASAELLALCQPVVAANLSPTVLARLKAGWQEEFDRGKRRDLSARRYVHIWVDGVYLQGRRVTAAHRRVRR